jgi:hypothetical protein
MCAFTLFVAVLFAIALFVTTVNNVVLTITLGGPDINVTIAGLPFVIAFPLMLAPILTLPATALVNVIVASPFALVVAVALPTIVPVPLKIANVTV